MPPSYLGQYTLIDGPAEKRLRRVGLYMCCAFSLLLSCSFCFSAAVGCVGSFVSLRSRLGGYLLCVLIGVHRNMGNTIRFG